MKRSGDQVKHSQGQQETKGKKAKHNQEKNNNPISTHSALKYNKGEVRLKGRATAGARYNTHKSP